ncbi:MAG: hypothetical protein AAFN93_11145 [Bacteroidota bacterium]
MDATDTPKNEQKEELIADLNFLLSKINHPGGLRRVILAMFDYASRLLSARKNKKLTSAEIKQDEKTKQDHSEYSYIPLIDDIEKLLVKVKSSVKEDFDAEMVEKIKLENRYKRIVIWPNIISGLIYILLGCLAAWVLYLLDIADILTDDNSTKKYYIVGVAGTILYYAIKIVKSERRKDKVQLLFARLTITLIACCVVLISLNPSSTDHDFELKEDGHKTLLFFVCGYSVEIVIQLVNKIIEKVNGMIDSI